MLFEPEKIKYEHIIEAAKTIDSGEFEITASTGYDVIIDGKPYPPKEIMRFAHEKATGVFNWHPGGGEPTNKYLTALGFKIIDKKNTDPWLNIIEDYKSIISKNENYKEIYKWKLILENSDKLNTNASDFNEEIRSVKFQNLVYHHGIAALYHMTKVYPIDVRNCFRALFDETTPLIERIEDFTKNTLKIYRKVEPVLNHHQDERTIATYLTFKYPNKYTFYKDSFYKKLCKRINVPSEKKGRKYIHYLSLVSDFIKDYVKKDQELLNLKNTFLTADCFKDENNLIFAQDILYQSLENPLQFDRNYWRIGTHIDDESYWAEMEKDNFIAIGWDRLGDLNENNINSRNDVQKLLQSKNYYTNDNRLASKQAGQIYSFYEDIQNGDVVLAQEGDKVLGICIIKDDYDFIGDTSAAHQHEVEWINTNPNLKNSEGRQTTVYKLSDIDLIKKIEDLIKNNETKTGLNMSKKEYPLNQILYGPPGTGKTFNSINKALEILGENLSGLDRIGIKKLYKKKVKEGRIVFTTFHQSMSYEDFIEGIKPLPPEDNDGQVGYEVVSGIFKNICEDARNKSNSNFDEAYNSLLKEITKLDGELFEVKTPTNKPFYVVVNSKNNLNVFTGKDKKKQGVFTKEKLLRQLNGENIYIGWEGYYTGIINLLKEKYQLITSTENVNKKYILIIDEINRGNVSQIFGELITLIEEDKREGKEEELEITLPYSKEKFSVPDNLYIIGTMNTADRSVEALDTALRRRFSFVEMPPDIEVLNRKKVGEISANHLSTILIKINERLEKLLGKDHLIGHSFFLNVSDIDDLKIAFQNKIIPLLQEYFYGDYGKIGLVLGKGFVKIKEDKSDIFSNFDYDADTIKEKVIYELVDFTKKKIPFTITLNEKVIDMSFENAIKFLLNQTVD